MESDREILNNLARAIHEAKLKLCWGKTEREPWPEHVPGDFGYEPCTWVDIAWAQAKAARKVFNK